MSVSAGTKSVEITMNNGDTSILTNSCLNITNNQEEFG